MKTIIPFIAITFIFCVKVEAQTLFPSQNAQMVNPDVKLKLTFNAPPKIGTSGKIRIYDAADDRLVDMLEVFPPGRQGPSIRRFGLRTIYRFPTRMSALHARQIATPNRAPVRREPRQPTAPIFN
jgi:hypothetical protein